MHWTLFAARILVVTATEGFRHDSIEVAESTIQELAAAQSAEVVFARTNDDLRSHIGFYGISAVIFVNTTGELDPVARQSLLAWVTRGGTFVGIHSATDTWHSSPEYIEMIGAEFASHPPDFEATFRIEAPSHLATKSLPSPHVMLEEIYSFANVAGDIHVLMTVDGAPVAWEKRYGNGEVLYTALGHREDVWQSPWFRAHVRGILTWTLAQQRAGGRRRAASSP
ncbi:MAG TPA: ThuA domain-containing protein [Thermoanaerobaculia bacterium]|nr:ThuA domain-containing protein [Thermoanaerobaculia bacterium]